jgi:rubrerythrin
MTETNLRDAYSGESQAHMRYTLYAHRAQKPFPEISRLFRAIAFAERVHAGNHYRNIVTKGAFRAVGGALFGTRNTSDDLQAGIDGETFEVNEMYPAYMAVAKFQEERSAEISFTWAWEAEKTHAAFFTRAKQAVDQGHDVWLQAIQVCEVCGYTVEGDAPDRCPICQAVKDRFRAYE